MNRDETMTVGKYLVSRLEEMGLKHIFGVPGDYVLPLFDYLEESSIEVVGNCNELNAGYAADAYARMNGLGTVCVTYGVGGFSLINAVVGAYAERVPLIAISGAPRSNEPRDHHLLHHTIGNTLFQDEIYQKVTLYSQILTDRESAPRQIDNAFDKCLTYKRPVYLEVPLDVIGARCDVPEPLEINTEIRTDEEALDEAVSETLSILDGADNPAILAGIESHRLGTKDALGEVIDRSGYPFATTLLGKGVMRENHDQFVGVYNGHMGKETAKETVEGAEVLLNLGALMTDMNMGIWSASLDKKRMVVANSDRVRIKHHHYDHVSLKSFLEELASRISRVKSNEKVNLFVDTLVSETEKDSPGKNLTVQYFYDRINDFINDENVLIADTGDSILNASNLLLPEGADYIGQAFYLSIGYSVPAALGAGLSRSDKRPVVFVGDGAFQMTAQGLSTILRRGLNPIFFLMNNSGYTIERVFHDGKYNDIHGWEYYRIPEVFGGKAGMRVKTRGDLEKALDHAATAKDELVFIEVVLEKKDWSNNLEKLERIVKNNQHSG